jgi:Mrp family chromosome partitioning ATPase
VPQAPPSLAFSAAPQGLPSPISRAEGAIDETPKPKHPRSIAVVNYKGGVGKTTATFFLSAQIAHDEPKKRVLIIDIDAQCSLTSVFGIDPTASNAQTVLGADPTLLSSPNTCMTGTA